MQNESSAQSSNKDNDMSSNRTKRFEFLLKQTEIFSHFMPGTTGKITPEKKKSGRKKEKEEAKREKEEAKAIEDALIDPAE
jgi:SWI/SNF-related matrix-associated actin-dependent regulator of chromatin subfamily A member 5